MEKVLNDFKKEAINLILTMRELRSLLKSVAYWLKDIADSLEKDKSDIENKSLSENTISLIEGNPNDVSYETKAERIYFTCWGSENHATTPTIGEQLEKTFSKWPQIWYSAQEAIVVHQ